LTVRVISLALLGCVAAGECLLVDVERRLERNEVLLAECGRREVRVGMTLLLCQRLQPQGEIGVVTVDPWLSATPDVETIAMIGPPVLTPCTVAGSGFEMS
jgi:hypothetical protein